MAEEVKTPDQAAAEQAEPQPVTIDFSYAGQTVKLDVPFKTPVWYWILTHPALGLDPNLTGQDLTRALIATIGMSTRRILSVATGITEADLTANVPADDLDRVCDDVAEQLGRELTAAAPFSNFPQAIAAVNRTAKVMRGARVSAGRQPSSPSRRKSAAGRERKSTA